jgi:hypothetical protein
VDIVFESATERVRRELDPKYRVIFDDVSQTYYVTRWRQTGCGQGYYAVQGRGYKVWDEERILEFFKHGHWRTQNLTEKDLAYEVQQDRERVAKEQDAKLSEASREMGKDLLDLHFAPVVHSIPGVQTTRLQE